MTCNSIVVSLVIFHSVASVAGAGTAFADSRPELTVAVTKLARHLDPMGQNANVNERVGENIIENLIRYTELLVYTKIKASLDQ